MENDSVLFIGKKDIERYIATALLMREEGVEEITMKARGQLIKKAVDIAEILRRRYFLDAERYIEIGTEEMKMRDSTDGKTLHVSTVDITYKF